MFVMNENSASLKGSFEVEYLYRRSLKKSPGPYLIFEPPRGRALIQAECLFERGAYLNFLDVKVIKQRQKSKRGISKDTPFRFSSIALKSLKRWV